MVTPDPSKTLGSPIPDSRGKIAFAAIAAFVVAVVAYLGALDGTFVLDDETYVVKNTAVIGDSPPFTSATPPNRKELGLYRPLTIESYRLQFQSGGLDPSAFRRVNVALHALVSALLVLVAIRLGTSATVAGTIGIWFAAHPVHVEAVAWIVGRAELLATFFALLAILARPRTHGSGSSGAAKILRTVLMALAYLAAGSSKESALPLPLALVAIDAFERVPLRDRLARFGLLSVALLALVAARIAVLGHFSPDVAQDPLLGGLPLLSRIELGIRVLGRTLIDLVVPTGLSIYYEPRTFAGPWLVLLGIALALFAVIAAWRGKTLAVRAGAMLFIAGMLPFLHVVPIGWIFGDRFLYLASAGFLLAIGAAAPRTPSSARIRTACAIAIALALFGLTIVRAPVFHDDLSLWRDAAAKDESSGFAQFQIAGLLEAEGKLEYVSDEQRGAVQHWKQSLAVDPNHLFALEAHLELGEYAASRLRDADEAAKHYRQAAGLDPETRNPHCIDALIDLAGLFRSDAGSGRSVVQKDETISALVRAANGQSDARQKAIIRGLVDALEKSNAITATDAKSVRDCLERPAPH